MVTRRDILASGGVGVVTLVAGCVQNRTSSTGDTPTDGATTETARTESSTQTDTESDTPTETVSAHSDTPTETSTAPTNTETVQLEHSQLLQLGPILAQPDWARGDSKATADVIETKAQAQKRLYGTDIETFISQTDFDRSLILEVASVGPDQCHDQFALDRMTVSDGVLHCTARVVDTSQEGELCGQALTYPHAAIRATFASTVPQRVSITVTDGWGASTTFER